jgi:hypothetical protein
MERAAMTAMTRGPAPSKSQPIATPPTGPAPVTGVTAGQLALTFVPFGLGLVFAMWYAELQTDLRLYRAIYAIRLSLLVTLPALALFPFRDRTPGLRNVWRLFWTFGMLAYLVHLAYSWFGVFGGQLATARLHPDLFKVAPNPTVLDLVIAHQGREIAYGNLVLTGLWAFDVFLAWVAAGARGAGRAIVVGIHALMWLAVLGAFVIASIVFAKNTTVFVLGWAMVGSVAIALLARLVGGGGDTAARGR